MVSIDTFHANGPVRIGDRTFTAAGSVPIRVWMNVFAAIVLDRVAKKRSRMHLKDLTDEQLRDIGVTREQAEREAARPVW